MSCSVDLTGNKYGRLTVISRAEPIMGTTGHLIQRWNCVCDCGNTCIIRHGNLTSGTSTSCGCWKSEATSARERKDYIGKRFGKLTVVKRTTDIGVFPSKVLCLCDCGHYCEVRIGNLVSGNTTSCGCMRTSMNEAIIQHTLDILNIDYEKEKTFNDLIAPSGNPYRYDFAIHDGDEMFLLEYQGIQHFCEAKKGSNLNHKITKRGDEAKAAYAKQHNIELVFINYFEDTESKLFDILSEHHLLYGNTVPSRINTEGVTTISEESSF